MEITRQRRYTAENEPHLVETAHPEGLTTSYPYGLCGAFSPREDPRGDDAANARETAVCAACQHIADGGDVTQVVGAADIVEQPGYGDVAEQGEPALDQAWFEAANKPLEDVEHDDPDDGENEEESDDEASES